ncbi:MAG: hypothetical protein B6I19_00490 [Bacteroidetes bacterium 4572_114]|nr:MAG: hypothetical protein B6I19_00490 [Bacteroidetes bacterium 4572_114]
MIRPDVGHHKAATNKKPAFRAFCLIDRFTDVSINKNDLVDLNTNITRWGYSSVALLICTEKVGV